VSQISRSNEAEKESTIKQSEQLIVLRRLRLVSKERYIEQLRASGQRIHAGLESPQSPKAFRQGLSEHLKILSSSRSPRPSKEAQVAHQTKNELIDEERPESDTPAAIRPVPSLMDSSTDEPMREEPMSGGHGGAGGDGAALGEMEGDGAALEDPEGAAGDELIRMKSDSELSSGAGQAGSIGI